MSEDTAALPLRFGTEMTLPPPTPWLVPPYFPAHRLMLLDGLSGIGKGLFCAWLAVSRLMKGEFVLWLTAEDDPEEDIYRRLLAAGWDSTTGQIGFFDGSLALPRQWEALAATIKLHRPGLVVMDPGRSFLRNPDTGEFQSKDEASVRPGLQRLSRIAIVAQTLIVFVHHWNRNSTATASNRFSGAAAFLEVVRHRVSLAWFGTTEHGEGAFSVTKTNITSKGHTRLYRTVVVPELDTARFVWGDAVEDAGEDFDTWCSQRAEPSFRMEEEDPVDVLATSMAGHPSGADMPAQDVLRRLTRLSTRKLEAGVRGLTDRGWIMKRPGKSSVWVGPGVSTNGHSNGHGHPT